MEQNICTTKVMSLLQAQQVQDKQITYRRPAKGECEHGEYVDGCIFDGNECSGTPMACHPYETSIH